ncbi:hypothetical protein FKP32DRAFT_106678 [Trametes sanguinea]|nr:hypothetical protein FKP32DRAFT_106678 [Trametes sanguinea]
MSSPTPRHIYVRYRAQSQAPKRSATGPLECGICHKGAFLEDRIWLSATCLVRLRS